MPWTHADTGQAKRGGSGFNYCRQETYLVDQVKDLNTPAQYITPSWFSVDERLDILDIESTP